MALTWELRRPLRHGSKHVGMFESEAAARIAAEKLIAKDFPGHGIIVVGRVVYIDHGDDI
jgi:hypothetical protein